MESLRAEAGPVCCGTAVKYRPRFLRLEEKNIMSKYFAQDASLAGLERLVVPPPNFTPDKDGVVFVCSFRKETPALEELTRELIRFWRHAGLRRRAVLLSRCTGHFRFDGPLHPLRMLKQLSCDKKGANKKYLAALYLLSSSAGLWERSRPAFHSGTIDFSAVRLGGIGVQEYTLYRAAKGISSGRLGVGADELADGELISDHTLLLILHAALIARFGPQVMESVGADSGSYEKRSVT